MADAPQSALPFFVLLVLTFAFAGLVIAFAVSVNFLMLAAAVPVAAGMAWAGRKVLA